jgi:hypothetical protein
MECSCAAKDVRTPNFPDARSKNERGSTRRERGVFTMPSHGLGYLRGRIIVSSRWRVRSRTCSNALKCDLGTWPKHFSIATVQG